MQSTYIEIDIQSERDAVLTCIKDTFKVAVPEWTFYGNANTALWTVPLARFFRFEFSDKRFHWYRGNHSFSETMDEDEVVIKSVEDISYLLEFIYEYSEKLMGPLIMPKQKLTYADIWNSNVGYIYSDAIGKSSLNMKAFADAVSKKKWTNEYEYQYIPKKYKYDSFDDNSIEDNYTYLNNDFTSYFSTTSDSDGETLDDIYDISYSKYLDYVSVILKATDVKHVIDTFKIMESEAKSVGYFGVRISELRKLFKSKIKELDNPNAFASWKSFQEAATAHSKLVIEY